MLVEHPKQLDEITPEWLTCILKEVGIIKNSKIKNIKQRSLADGKAWLSNVIRLEVEYDSDFNDAPKSFVLKMLSKSEFRESKYELEAYDREIKFYKELGSIMPIRLPKLYYSKNGPNYNFMLMEDLSYLIQGDLVKGMKQEQVLVTVESLAKVHGTYWENPILDTLDWMPTSNNIEVDYNENWDSFVELCSHFIDPEGIKVGEKLRPHISWLFQEIASRPRTLTHDDMKEDNLLFGEPGTDEDVVLLDWQFAIRSMGATDVARLIGGSQTPSERKGRQFEALKYWYDKLLEQGVKDYSWEEAQRDFKLGALYCLCFPVHFHKGIVRAEGRALEYVIAMYSRLFSHVVEIEADSVLP